MPGPVNVLITLSPSRKRAAKSLRKLLINIGESDAKLYAKGKPFLPIFPNTNTELDAAILLIIGQVNAVIDPQRT
jgi:hypothetical protein